MRKSKKYNEGKKGSCVEWENLVGKNKIEIVSMSSINMGRYRNIIKE